MRVGNAKRCPTDREEETAYTRNGPAMAKMAKVEAMICMGDSSTLIERLILRVGTEFKVSTAGDLTRH